MYSVDNNFYISELQTYGKIKEAEWLNKMFEKFYENILYKEIREILDWGDQHSKFEKLKLSVEKVLDNKKRSYEEKELVENLTIYLNFFQLIATFKDLKQLKINEIRKMFDYYLRLLVKYEWVIKYMEEEQFDITLNLAKEMALNDK